MVSYVKAAAEKALQEQKEKEEYEEYLKLKEQFTVDEEGTDALEIHADVRSHLRSVLSYSHVLCVLRCKQLICNIRL